MATNFGICAWKIPQIEEPGTALPSLTPPRSLLSLTAEDFCGRTGEETPQALKEDSQKLDGLSLMEEMKEKSKEQMDANFQSDVAKTKNIY